MPENIITQLNEIAPPMFPIIQGAIEEKTTEPTFVFKEWTIQPKVTREIIDGGSNFGYQLVDFVVAPRPSDSRIGLVWEIILRDMLKVIYAQPGQIVRLTPASLEYVHKNLVPADIVVGENMGEKISPFFLIETKLSNYNGPIISKNPILGVPRVVLVAKDVVGHAPTIVNDFMQSRDPVGFARELGKKYAPNITNYLNWAFS